MITDQFFHLIDLLVGDKPGQGNPQFCSMPHPEKDLTNKLLLAEGWVSYCDPLAYPTYHHRRPYERSLWLRRVDNRCAPELLVLAVMKFGALMIRADAEPFWTDKNWLNNSIDNVSMPLKPEVGSSKIGARAGTPEYRKLYYAIPENRDKQRLAARKSAARKRALVRRARTENVDVFQQLKDQILGPVVRGDDDDV